MDSSRALLRNVVPIHKTFYSSGIYRSLHRITRELKQTVFTLILKLKPKTDKASSYSSSLKVILTIKKPNAMELS